MTVVDNKVADNKVAEDKALEVTPDEITPVRPRTSILSDPKNLLVIGTAIGVEIRGADLHLGIVRGRPNRVTVVAAETISNFRERTPAEWGREVKQFLQEHGQKHLAATVLLPRREVIVRLAAMPGVTTKDIPGALAFQIDSMHPYGDDAVSFAWSRADANSVLVGIIRTEALDSYVALFQAAAIPVASFTFSASAIYSALRLYGKPPKNFVVLQTEADSTVEIYGESDSRAVFSAEFDLPPARAAALARAELRLAAANVETLDSILPIPANLTAISPAAYATGLAALGRWHAPFANLLPVNARTVHSRIRLIPSLVLGFALVSVAAGWFAYWQFRDSRYLAQLESSIAQVQPVAKRAEVLDRLTKEHRDRLQTLDDYRKRSQSDLEIMAELSRLLPPTVWTNSLEILSDSVVITGEAEQAAPLLKILDSSPLFHSSEFSMGVMRNQTGEAFRIRTLRKVRK